MTSGQREPASEKAVRLSICIATFNRGQFIGETLSSIVNQLDDSSELIIVDGASTDDTELQVRAFAGKYPRLQYFREAKNSGVDEDFDKAVGYAKGSYVWLMTDDDLLVPGAIGVVLEAIRQEEDLIVVNAEVDNLDFTRVLNERLYRSHTDVVYSQSEIGQFFIDAAQCLTFIGCAVVKREFWMSRDRRSYYGSLFVHVGVIFQYPPIQRVRIVATPQVRIRYGNAMWTARSFEIWMFKWPELIWSFNTFDEKVKAQVVASEPWRDWKKLFLLRSKNAYSFREYERYFTDVSDSKFRLLARCVSVAPVWLANVLSLLYLALSQRRNLTPMYDLVGAQPFRPLRLWLTRIFGF